MRQKLGTLVFVSLFVLSLTGCGNSMPTAATSPSTLSDTSSVAGAKITGSVAAAPTGLAASTVAGVSTGLTVSVSGTTVNSAVDVNGRFTLANVPPGPIELWFMGPGVNARVQIGVVSTGDTLEINVTVSGTTAQVNGSASSHDNHREIEGLVEAVPPVTAAGQFKVAGTTIITTAATTYKLNGHTGLFKDLVVGARVHVKADISATGVVATDVNIQSLNTPPNGGGNDGDDDNGDDDGHNEAEVSGLVTSLTGTCPAVQFMLGGTKVVTNASTHFVLACTAVTASAKVEVKGTRAADGTVTATQVKKD